MKKEICVDETLSEPEQDALARIEYRHELSALAGFRENLEGSENLLFLILAEKLRAGTLHQNKVLMEFLAGACERIADGTPPHEALEFTIRGRKKKHFGDWLRCVYEVSLIRQLSDLPLEEIYPIVSGKLVSFGIPLGVESVKRHYKKHRKDIPPITRDNVHERLCWIAGHYVTPTGTKSSELGAFAQELERELFERVKNQSI